jgi:hypothetical protein
VKPKFCFAGLAGLALIAGCGNSDNTMNGGGDDLSQSPPDLAMATGDLTVVPDLTPPAETGYPAGPYGTTIGSVAPDFRFKGYFSQATTGLATAVPYADVSYNTMRTSGAKYALVMLAGFS